MSVSNRSPEKVDATVARAKEEGDLPLKGYKDPKSFVESLSKPRKIVLLVQAGKAVDATIATLSELLEVSVRVLFLSVSWYTPAPRHLQVDVRCRRGIMPMRAALTSLTCSHCCAGLVIRVWCSSYVPVLASDARRVLKLICSSVRIRTGAFVSNVREYE